MRLVKLKLHPKYQGCSFWWRLVSPEAVFPSIRAETDGCDFQLAFSKFSLLHCFSSKGVARRQGRTSMWQVM